VLLKHSPTAKVPLLKTRTASSPIRWRLPNTWPNNSRPKHLWPADITARAQARSACAQMHSGFFAMRNHMPFNLSHDAPLAHTA
jgi:glutathione S-transferase